MRYHALATDYDGTLADEGAVAPGTVAALERLRESGRKAVLVTGRTLADLARVFPRLDLFDRVVAENGALLYRPRTREQALLGPPPPAAFLHRLRAQGCTPLSLGRVIVATLEPNERLVREAIGALPLQVSCNKGAVMVLPAGVDKRTGLLAALDELSLSPRGAVAVGDAENDEPMLAASECGVAVANALRPLKERADFVTRGASGQGVQELIDRLLDDDLRTLLVRRHDLALGERVGGGALSLSPFGKRVLVAGAQAGAGLLVLLTLAGYQCLVLGAAPWPGAPAAPPALEGLVSLLDSPRAQVRASLAGLPAAERPAFVARLLQRLQALRARTGRPHWIVLEEAHQLVPVEWAPPFPPRELGGLLLLTPSPALVAPALLSSIDLALAEGEDAAASLRPFLEGRAAPSAPPEPGEVLAWSGGRVERVRLAAGQRRPPAGAAPAHAAPAALAESPQRG